MADKYNVSLYRKRFIPYEVNNLKKDVILHMDESKILTSWNALKPRKDIKRGVSAYFLNRGYKVSKLYDNDDNIVYWYCDIINVIKKPEDNAIVFEDLLLDVIVYEDGKVVVMDADELATALETNLINQEYACMALRNMNDLLKIIYSGQFEAIMNYIDDAEVYYTTLSK